MKLLFGTLCVCLALAVSFGAPTHHIDTRTDHNSTHTGDHEHHAAKPDRCDGIEFDAIAPDENGTIHFFKGDQVWKGFKMPSELVNGTFHELDDHHHVDHVDAAFRMHRQDQTKDHDHIFIFMGDKVFSYYNHSLEKGYPKEIRWAFPGIPNNLDAAVECPKGECIEDSVIFFKGENVYHFDVNTKTVKEKEWPQLPRCTSALRWLEHYYCVHGHNFTRFNAVTGAVPEGYPKDMRGYFMTCPGFDHGHEKHFNCTNPQLDAITTDDAGKAYSFKGELYLRLDNQRDGLHPFPIANTWKEVHSNVDAVFSYDNKLYFIKGQQVYIYKSGAHYTLVEGYPKSLKEELGVEGPVNAAFACEGKSIAYIIQGQKMYSMNLTTTPRTMMKDTILPMTNVGAATCDHQGVRLFVGSDFYRFDNPNSIAVNGTAVLPQKTPKNILGCDNQVPTIHSGTHASN
ncbi:hemopexin isoform X3 [Brienomyrus brachyistius]|uniref:hemopexin isoform X3 n=1 Tax=Brienomyrus brachyistius TaxID=42636 RepID=UPI0020B3DF68|nr:hemopexin isoform X3 [Brienomyrus brachyistius]